jgi:nitroimidazol reductase NimA-like FMN-containing flavoprotein (pyridoxamine 5'-phosphate oxidase superfamily)
MLKEEREIRDSDVIQNILRNGKYTTISLCKQNEPYIITLSYGFDSEKKSLYFHSAKQGLKFEFLKDNPKVCGTIVEDHGYNKNDCSHSYRSIVFWGQMVLIKEISEKIHGFNILLNHLEENPEELKNRFLKSLDKYDHVNLLRLDISEITCKGSV